MRQPDMVGPLRGLIGFVAASTMLALPGVGAAQTPAGAAQSEPPSSSSPRISPDGRHIAFVGVRDGSRGLYVMNADGGEARALANAVPHARLVGWTRTGEILIATESADSAMLFALPADGASAPRPFGRAHGRNPVLAPNGTAIVTSVGGYREARLLVSALDGSEARLVTDTGAAAFNPAWSPDGQRLAYSRLDAASSIAVWAVNVDGTGATALTSFPPQMRAQVPAWSPDGRLVAFQVSEPARADATKRVAHIAVLDPAAQRVTRLAELATPHLDEVPVWFPDGERLAFQSNRSGVMEIWTMNADGTDLRQLTRSDSP